MALAALPAAHAEQWLAARSRHWLPSPPSGTVMACCQARWAAGRALGSAWGRPQILRFSSASHLLMGAGAGLCAGLWRAAAHRRSARTASSTPGLAARHAASVSELPEAVVFRDGVGPAVELTPTRADAWRGHTLVLFLRAHPEGEEGPPELGRIGEAVDKDLGGALRNFIDEELFDAKEGSAKVLHVFGKDVKRIAVVGLGSAGRDEVDWRIAGATAAGTLASLRSGSAGLACVEGVLLGLHKDKRFLGTKTPEKDKEATGPKTLELLGAFPPGSATAVEKAQAVASGVLFARELVNGAPNVVTPPNLAATAADMASRLGLSAKILDEQECEALGMGSFLAVGRASDLPAKLIHLTYSPAGDSPTRKLGIVGKGLTFDSGGYNLKAGAGSMIEMMKFDMGGAAAALGAAAAIARLKPKDVEVHFVVATCENMISGNPGALRPGDIITAMDGTTIEVNNTDAEGRLTLADALLYCQDQGVTEVIDIATLTGACMVALGEGIAGMWSNSDDLASRLESRAKACGEKLWRMPLEQSYFDGLKSDFADMKNTGPRFGGAITAALFLQKFVRKDINWAHLDIAGTVWASKPGGTCAAVGGTGSMVRTLTDLVTAG